MWYYFTLLLKCGEIIQVIFNLGNNYWSVNVLSTELLACNCVDSFMSVLGALIIIC